DDGGGSLDVDDVHFLAHLVGAVGFECAGGPDLAGQLDASAGPVDAFQGDGLSAFQGVDAGGELGWPSGPVSVGGGAYGGDAGGRDDGEDDDLGDRAAAEDAGGHGRGDRAHREHAEFGHRGDHE